MTTTVTKIDTTNVIRSADILLLDCGTMTGQGHELELPKATLPFFRLRRHRQYIDLVIGGKRRSALIARRPDNHMTRIDLGKHSPTYGEQGRSKYAARFLRDGDRYLVEFFEIGSLAYVELRETCAINGLWQSVKRGPKTNRPRQWGCM